MPENIKNNSVPARRKKGRPTKFVPALRKRLVEIIAIGTPLRFACAACRISYAAFCEYRIAHPDFDSEIEAARAASIEKHLRSIITAAEGGDTASSRWYLERCFPAEFGRSRIELTGENGSPLAVGIGIYLPRKDGEEIKPLPAAAIENEN
jgi:hypothetical protein